MSSTLGEASMLDVLIERHAFIRASGDVDDVLSVELRNTGALEHRLDCGLKFVYTDSTTEFICARDHGGTWVPRYTERLLETGELIVDLEGGVPPSGRRILGVKVRRHALATKNERDLFFGDRFHAMELPDLKPRRVIYRATAVFPATPFRRTVNAPDALGATGRTATWDWGEARGMGKYLPMWGHTKRVDLPPAPRSLDNALAEVYELLADCLLGDVRDLRRLRACLADCAQFTPEVQDKVPDDATFLSQDQASQELYLRWLLERLHEALEDLVSGKRIFATGVAPMVIERAERWGAIIAQKHVNAPMPPNAYDTLEALLQYQSAQRESPNVWDGSLDEKAFQKHFRQFLGSRAVANVPEVSIAGGRVDFLLGSTPVELKVRDLKGNPEKELANHRQQAAEYAAAMGYGLGFLLVLDEHRYGPKSPHLPPPDDLVSVDPVPSAPGTNGQARTLVVSIIVPAYPPEPSKMAATPEEKALHKKRAVGAA
ncbi:hypothetical protein ACLESD_26585 [Pyxidicoccus sp. 3LFB2]